MNSVTQRLIIQLRQERDEIDAAIRQLEGEPDSVPEKPKRIQRRKRKIETATLAAPVTTIGRAKQYTPCIHGCGKEFKNDGWRARHEADCAFVVKPNGSAEVGRRAV